MIQQSGYWWPDDVGAKWQHSLKHVRSVEWAISQCQLRRTAVQAGGNVGLWPKRLADVFARVITFEPDAISRACLVRNVPAWVEVRSEALGDGSHPRCCGLVRQSLGSHYVTPGDRVPMVTIDDLELTDLDFLQLDVEGYEWYALTGAVDTIARCHPLIQVELRGFSEQYGQSDAAIHGLLKTLGYRAVKSEPGNDVVFGWFA